jgi:hypothetical protein
MGHEGTEIDTRRGPTEPRAVPQDIGRNLLLQVRLSTLSCLTIAIIVQCISAGRGAKSYLQSHPHGE